MKKFFVVILTLLSMLTLITTTACGKEKNPNEIHVGILQVATHDALDNARQGFKDTLDSWAKEKGKTIVYNEKNANGDDRGETSFAKNMASEKPDLMLGVSTSSARALSICKGKIPTLFTAVTDPVAEGLTTKSNVTGTSDLNPVEKQIDFIKELAGDKITTIGFLYNSAEKNSETQYKIACDYCKKIGIKIEKITADSVSNISTVVKQYKNKVDAMYVPTDNLMASNMNTICPILRKVGNKTKGVPVVAGDIGMCRDGEAIGTIGIDYYKLGVQTAKIAIKILEGKKPSELEFKNGLKFEYFNEEPTFYINEKNAKEFGYTDEEIAKIKENHKVA